MPVLEPNPQNGQKKLLLVFGAIFGILVVIGVIISIAAPEPHRAPSESAQPPFQPSGAPRAWGGWWC